MPKRKFNYIGYNPLPAANGNSRSKNCSGIWTGNDAFILTKSGRWASPENVLFTFENPTTNFSGNFNSVSYQDGPTHGRDSTNSFVGGVLTGNNKVILIPRKSPNIGIYDIATNTYADGPSHGRGEDAFNGGVLLLDGRVVLCPLRSSTIGIYDPISNSYTNGPAHSKGDYAFASSVLTQDNKVLMIPGNASSGILYDPETNSISNASTGGSLDKFSGGVLLPNGKIVLAPMYRPNSLYIVVYDPVNNTSNSVAAHNLSGNYIFNKCVLLPDGRVFFNTAEQSTFGLYDPDTQQFTSGPTHPHGNWAFSHPVLLPCGIVLLVGTNQFGYFDPASDTYTEGPANPGGSNGRFNSGTLIPSGKVVLAPINSSVVGIITPDPLISVSASIARNPTLNKL